MNKACRDLRKKNNEREKAIFKENDEVYTNMIVYLRGADITPYHQELVREDLIELIIDGQERGDNIAQVMGNRYQEICDEIIAVMPKRTIKEKIRSCIETSLSCVWVLSAIYVVMQLISELLSGTPEYQFTLTVGTIVNGVIIIIIANVIVEYFCKTALKEKKQTNKLLVFAKTWVVTFTILAAITFGSIYLTTPVLVVPMIGAVAFVGLVFVAERVLAAV